MAEEGELERLRAERAAIDARIKALTGAVEGPAVSPLAPAAFPALPAIAGVEMATANSGTK
ncbi:MAG: bifunctional ornithine acetyltransferase/N-acetylglutamate synthase, partial [Pseudomonadota bacterium]